MQKTLALLEKNVEWIALVLGGVFVVYCAYAYVVTPPATVRIGGQALGPGDVSDLTDKLVKDMKRQIDATNSFKPIDVPQVVTAWQSRMAMPTPPAPTPEYVWVSRGSSITGPGTGTAKLAGPFHVDALVQLPPAQAQSVQSGLSQVAMAPQGGPAAGNAQPAANIAMEDMPWVTAAFTISKDALRDAFQAPLTGQKIKPQALDQLYRTAFLEVELQRQRATGIVNNQPVFPNGDTGIETVPPLRIQKDDLVPMPDAKANPGAKANFINWAEIHEELITQPKFYEVKAGTVWNSPIGGQNPAPGAAVPPGAVPPPIAARPPVNPLPMPNGIPNAVPAAGGNPGAINPLNIEADVTLWAHDETAKPGETYRYRLIYHMKNPVIGEENIAGDKVINVLDIPSAPSAWSAPVLIPQKLKFWVATVNRTGVEMDIFQYSQGQWQKTKTSALSPGDQVPQTDWEIVDVHNGAGRDKYVLLADADGEIKRHPASERNDSDYKQMLDLVTKPTGPAGSPVPGTPNPRATPSPRGMTTDHRGR